MKIKICLGDNFESLTNYLEWNNLSFHRIDLFDPEFDKIGGYNLAVLQDSEPQLLVMNHVIFNDLCSSDASRAQLLTFCQGQNKLWVWNDADGGLQLVTDPVLLHELDHNVAPGSMTFFIDCQPVDTFLFDKFKKIKLKVFPNSIWMRGGRIRGVDINKKNCAKDFLMTAIKKPRKEFRDQLWNELGSRPGLLEHGHAYYKTREQPWICDQAIINANDSLDTIELKSRFTVSMDLYLDAWLELVPETFCDRYHYVTEKTIKPISTKTPFLILSTPGYLKYLRNKGFRTFHGIIDESYDEQWDREVRIRMIVDQLEDIIRNGAKEFYLACTDILEHNQKTLFEIVGRWEFDMDQFILQQLQTQNINPSRNQ
jgi:hypothetical protein